VFHHTFSYVFVVLLIGRASRYTLFPYTTLFRSKPAFSPTMSKSSSWTMGRQIARQAFSPVMATAFGSSSKGIRGRACPWRHASRSEEHTSELQSRENLVCRLLPEKKKNITLQSK